MVATAPDAAGLDRAIRNIHARIAFYASTPAYAAPFKAHGLGELAKKLTAYSRARRWEEMPEFIGDEVLHTYATIGTWDDIVDWLRARYGHIVTHAEFSIAVTSADDKARLTAMVERLRAAPTG